MGNLSFLCVDFQREFTSPSGKCFRRRPSVKFCKETFFPYLSRKKIKIAEIISDYRRPRLCNEVEICIPGTEGFKSEVPEDLRKSVWIKAMNSPVWRRKNAGKTLPTTHPYVDDKNFTDWIKKNLPYKNCILFGLTLDRCILATAMELYFRGWKVKILYEAVDTYSGRKKEKDMLVKNVPVLNWAEVIYWKNLKKEL